MNNKLIFILSVLFLIQVGGCDADNESNANQPDIKVKDSGPKMYRSKVRFRTMIGVFLKKEPSYSSETLISSVYGNNLYAIGEDVTGKWVYVNYRNQTGYIEKEMLVLETEENNIRKPKRIERVSGSNSNLKNDDLDTYGLNYDSEISAIYRGYFEVSKINKDSPLLLTIFAKYLRTYATACTEYLPKNKIEMMDKQCSTEKVTRNGWGTVTGRECVSWVDVSSGLYADPVLYSTMKKIDGRASAKMIAGLFSGDLNKFGSSLFRDVKKLLKVGGDMGKLIQKNRCNSPELKRFEDNLYRFAVGAPPLLIDN